jgi:hypothetical protein
MSHKSRCLLVSIALFVVLLFGGEALSQTVTGTISGTVTDASGGIIPGATVMLISEKTGESRNVIANDEGRFSFAAVQPGPYTVKVEQKGFQTLERKGTVLSANENLALGDVPLQAGQVSETVTVVSSGAVVERESSNLTARLTADQIAMISTKGRDITSLLRLIPGTSNDDDVEAVGEGFGTNLPNISGQRGRSTVPTVDGLNAGEPSGSNKLSMTLNQDAVGEVQVLRNNYAAEYGNNGGAIINIVSKGGGKEYKGSVYYFLRNEALNASPFFTNKAGLKRPLYRHLYPGGTFGGPLPLPRFGEGGQRLLRDRAFFFVSVEKPHQITPTNAVFVTVPTALERRGDFSQTFDTTGKLIVVNDPRTGLPFPGNVIPQDRWNANGLSLLNVFPLPNSVGGRTQTGGAFNYVNQQSVDVPKHSYVIRFDGRPSSKDTVYWKGQWWTSDNVGLGTSGWPSGDANRWGINSHYLYTDNGWSANWVHIVNPKIVNEFNFGMRHDSEGFVPADGMLERFSRATTGWTIPQLFPQNNHLGTIPRVTSWSGVPGTPANINWLDRWGETGNDFIRPSFADNLSVTRGDHSLKFGAYSERLKNGEAPGGQWSGVFSFSNSTSGGFTTALGNTGYAYANALLGNFNSYTEASSRPFTNLELKLFQWYAQDQWKVTRRLTLNYGVRWGYHSPFFQVDKQGSNFDPALFSASNAPLLFVAFCKGQPNGVPPFGTACATANQFAVDPRVSAGGAVPNTSQLLNRNLIRAYIPGTGSAINGLALGTDPNTPRGYRTTRPVDWEPRLGLAWDLTGKGRTVLRAMGGLYHSPRAGGGTTGGNLVNNPPFQRSVTFNNDNFNNLANLFGTVNLATQTLFPTSVNAVESRSHTPTVYNFSLGVQRNIGFGTVMEVTYVGSVARHLGERRNINPVPDGARFVNCATTALFGVACHPENRDPTSASSALNDDFLRPYRGYGSITATTWSGTSNYNGLQVQVNRRYAKGFQYGVAYTWSKTFDYSKDDDTGDVNNGRPYKAFNYAPADFDQAHIFTVNYIWDVPLFRRAENRLVKGFLGGWQVSGTTSFATGKPKDFSATYSSTAVQITRGQTCPPGSIQSAASGSSTLDQCTPITDFTGGQINAVPFMVCDPNKHAGGLVDNTGTPVVINTACFQMPTRLGQIGDMGRNVGRRPNIFNTDLAFFKNIRLGEKRQIQLRWETYNLFNRSNFTDIDGGMTFGLVQNNPGGASATCSTTNVCTASYQQTNPRFGAVTAARAPRVMQVSIRLNF